MRDDSYAFRMFQNDTFQATWKRISTELEI